MEIPYTVEVRPDTGLSNDKLGVWLFLASEVMLFAALFSSYILLRVGSTEWPNGSEELSVPLAFFNTVVLITSSVTMVMAWASLKMNDFGKFRLFLGLTTDSLGYFIKSDEWLTERNDNYEETISLAQTAGDRAIEVLAAAVAADTEF